MKIFVLSLATLALLWPSRLVGADATGQVLVYVSYLNNLTGSPNSTDIPTPFDPDPNTILISSGGVVTPHDTGVIRFENRSDTPVIIDQVEVLTSTGVFRIWDDESLPLHLPVILNKGMNLVLAETQNFNFDTSNATAFLQSGTPLPMIVTGKVNENTFAFTDTNLVLTGQSDASGSAETTPYMQIGTIAIAP